MTDLLRSQCNEFHRYLRDKPHRHTKDLSRLSNRDLYRLSSDIYNELRRPGRDFDTRCRAVYNEIERRYPPRPPTPSDFPALPRPKDKPLLSIPSSHPHHTSLKFTGPSILSDSTPHPPVPPFQPISIGILDSKRHPNYINLTDYNSTITFGQRPLLTISPLALSINSNLPVLTPIHNSLLAPPDEFKVRDFGYGFGAPVQHHHYPRPPVPVPEPRTRVTFPLDPLRWHLLGQLEFYLSAQNMVHDFYLRQQMDDRGWIPIQLLASFNRVRQMTGEVNVDLVSEVLVLSEYIDVMAEHARMKEYEMFVLPNAPASEVERDDDDSEDDVVFVMGPQANGTWTPERRYK